MLSIRRIILTGLAVVAIGAIWPSKTIAQGNSSSGVVTVFDHEKMDASFTTALSNGGSNLLWSHASGNVTSSVCAQSRVREGCVQT
jgi:hypothetical protein